MIGSYHQFTLFMVECKTRGETLNSPVCKVLYFYYFSLIFIVHIYFTYKVTNSCIQSSVFLFLCKYKVLQILCKYKTLLIQSFVFLLFYINIYIIHLHYIQSYKQLHTKFCSSIILHKLQMQNFIYLSFYIQPHTKKVNQLHRVAKMNLSVQGR